MKKYLSRMLAALLCLIMIVSALPTTAFAANSYVASTTDDYYKLISKTDWELAPGVTESEIVLNNDAGTHRQVAHVVEVDINNEYTKVMPSYKGMAEGLNAKEYTVEVMSKQAAYAEANGYGNVVAAMNISLSWYDSAYYSEHPELVGEPLGYLVMDGVYYENSQGKTVGAKTCVVINFDEKDGVERPDSIDKVQIRSTEDPITGWEEQVIPANFDFLVKDGKNLYTKDHVATNGASRSFVGIKADGTFVMVMNDGRQAPFSTGFTTYEMAEFMLSLGCVVAINGDGGGSSTFLSQRPGEELKVNCSPSDGAERDTTHGILVISTAPATGEFVRATISSEYDYYTPNSEVSFSAVGSDLVGTSAEIPEEAKWQLADDSFGTIDQNGKFVSSGKEGEVKVQIVYKNEVVGEDSIHIVMPDKISVVQDTMVVPYGQTVDLGISASYDSKTVCIKESDIACELSDTEIGEIDGFSFTAAEEGTTHTKADLTITLGTLEATIKLSLGKGSQIVYDFEDEPDLSNWYIGSWYPEYGPMGNKKDENGNYYYNGQNEIGKLNIVSSEEGKVKNGEYALAAFCDFTQTYETGFLGVKFLFPEEIDCTDAIAVGFWMYIPYDARHAEIRLIANNSANTVYDNGKLWDLVEGWNYIRLDITQLANKTFQGFNIQVDDREPATSDYDYVNEPNLNGKYTFYIDDITLDYSSAVDDREAPVFSGLKGLNGESEFSLDGRTVSNSTLSFEVSANENTALSNATGIDADSAKAYIDGKEIACKYANGKISVTDAVLTNGIHIVRFEIADNAGNSSWVSGTVNVSAANDWSTIKVVPQDPTADRLKVGSLYWMDVKATDIETVQQVEMVFDLNNASTWELEGMVVTEGFSATWNIQEDENLATIIINRSGDNQMTGEAVLASFPVRTWVSTITECEGYEDQTPAKLVERGIIWAQSIELRLKKGTVTYVDDYSNNSIATFGMQDVLVDTELFFTNYTRKKVAGAEEWIAACKAAGVGFHAHTEKALTDKKATCTEEGYTGRTYCEECDSVIKWGTTEPMTEHSYKVQGNKLLCDCEKQYVGTGLVKVDGTYYYLINGNLVNGWVQIENGWYYFDEETYTSVDSYNNGYVTFEFENNGALVSGQWYQDQNGLRYYYGPDYYVGTSYGNKRVTIDGKEYVFEKNGYCLTGIAFEWVPYSTVYKWYDFGNDGAIKGAYDYTGLLEYRGYTYSIKDGVSIYGMSYVDGAYYYSASANYQAVITNTERTCPVTNGLMPVGVYRFGYDGKMVDEDVCNVDGVLYYYIKGQIAKNAGTFIFNDISYPIEETGKVLFSGTLKDASGKTSYYENGIEIEKTKNGLIFDEDGEKRYYKNGNAVYAGLVKDEDGNYYYINSSLKAVKSCTYTIGKSRSNGLLPAGTYEFDEQGKLIINIPDVKNGLIFDEDGEIRYYENGSAVYAGLVKDEDGNYYYINSSLKAVKSCTYTIGEVRSNGLLPAGTYEFDEQGKLIINIPDVKNGLIFDEDGEIRYYENGSAVYAGLVKDEDGNYYYINSSLKAVKSCTYTIGKSRSNGLLPAGTYEFDEQGKLIINIPDVKNGLIFDEDGEIRYYENGSAVYAGLVKAGDGNYYYVNSSLKAVKNCTYTIGEARANGLLPAGTYEFAGDGKLIMK